MILFPLSFIPHHLPVFENWMPPLPPAEVDPNRGIRSTLSRERPVARARSRLRSTLPCRMRETT